MQRHRPSHDGRWSYSPYSKALNERRNQQHQHNRNYCSYSPNGNGRGAGVVDQCPSPANFSQAANLYQFGSGLGGRYGGVAHASGNRYEVAQPPYYPSYGFSKNDYSSSVDPLNPYSGRPLVRTSTGSAAFADDSRYFGQTPYSALDRNSLLGPPVGSSAATRNEPYRDLNSPHSAPPTDLNLLDNLMKAVTALKGNPNMQPIIASISSQLQTTSGLDPSTGSPPIDNYDKFWDDIEETLEAQWRAASPRLPFLPAADSTESDEDNKAGFRCHICKQNLSSEELFADHIQSRAHRLVHFQVEQYIQRSAQKILGEMERENGASRATNR